MKIAYRPEIDGLRAVAVTTVVVYHARFSMNGDTLLAGGYLGVDIFFVISGYLISKIILTELGETGAFNFRNFYERRIRRILPILFTVMLSSVPFAWFYMLPATYADYSRSIVSSLLFVSNLFFYFSTTDYGASDSLLEPFLHTWSLSVEEQFYIFFPAALVLLFRLAQKHLFWVALAALVASLLVAETMSRVNPALSFYILPTRMWELLAGTLVALLEIRSGRAETTAMRSVIPLAGAAAVVLSFWMFDEATIHPGFGSVPLILGVALVIRYAGRHEPVGAILGCRPLVGIGLISYSLYLWHFPVFAFARMRDPAAGDPDKLWWIALTVLLSAASYLWIERPFRNRRKMETKRALANLRMGLLCTVLVSVSGYVFDGFVWRVPAVLAPEASRGTWNDLKDENGDPCHGRLDDFCLLGGEKKSRTVVVVGDSHAASLLADLYARVKDKHPFLALTEGDCLPVFQANLVVRGSPDRQYACNVAFQNRRLAAIAARGPSIIVVAGRWPRELEGSYFNNLEGGIEQADMVYRKALRTISGTSVEQEIDRSLRQLLDAGHDLILVYPFVEVGWNVPKELFLRMPKSAAFAADYLSENPLTTSFDVYKERTKSSFAVLDRVQHKNLYRVYPHKRFCNTTMRGRCMTHDAENMYYADDDHPNKTGSAMINDLIFEQINLSEARRTRAEIN